MKNSLKILIADDESSFRHVLSKELTHAGHQVEAVANGENALTALDKKNFQVLLLDLNMPKMGGIETLKRIGERGIPTETIVLTGQGTIPLAVEAIKLGAYDFLTKPCEVATVEAVCMRAADRSNLRKENFILKRHLRLHEPEFVGQGPVHDELRSLVETTARADLPVLLLGDSGTGKEVIARQIHKQSDRAASPLITINCASFNPTLLESEMFGHEKGAFTGAVKTRTGLFETADEGTVFLDEIGDMSMELQARLLRALQFGEVRRVGSDISKTVDVRVIAATNKDLKKEIQDKTFREDLFYRLQGIVISIPPLRDRKDEIPLLAEHFLKRVNLSGASPKGFSSAALKVLKNHDWPGNIRELENTVQRIALLSNEDPISEASALSAIYVSSTARSQEAEELTLEEAEKQHIARTLVYCDGNRKRAAAILDISLKSLYNKVQKFGL